MHSVIKPLTHIDCCGMSTDCGDVADVRVGKGCQIIVEIVHLGVLDVTCGIATNEFYDGLEEFIL